MPNDGEEISRSSTDEAATARSEAWSGQLDAAVKQSFEPQRTARSTGRRWIHWVLFLLSLAAVGIWPGAILINRRWYR